MTMTKKEMIIEAIESFGYKPVVDDDGDIYVRYQMKNIYFMAGQEDEPYVMAFLPQFSDVKEGEETFYVGCLQQSYTRHESGKGVYRSDLEERIS